MINKLVDNIKSTNAPIVVGLDPMMKFIPGHIKEAAFKEYGQTLEGAGEAIWQYNKGIIDAIYDKHKEIYSEGRSRETIWMTGVTDEELMNLIKE